MTISAAPAMFHTTPRAWCLVSNHLVSGTPTRAAFDERNFIDGYNLYIDKSSQDYTATNINFTGAMKFSFVTPMPNNKYRIFVNSYRTGASNLPFMCHALNSDQYPKTPDSFWIRQGYWLTGSPGTNDPPSVSPRTKNQIQNLRLWSNGGSVIGVYVL
jgi:hypothetical protein